MIRRVFLTLALCSLLLTGCGKKDDLPKDGTYVPEISMGKKEAPLTITTYSDYKCAHCGTFAKEIFPKIEEEYIKTGKVRYVYEDFPVDITDSWELSEASLCIFDQNKDKYWTFHKMVYQTKTYAMSAMEDFIKTEKLNLGKFKECMSSGKFKNAVKEKKRLAEMRGITGTPTFYIGGQKLVGIYGYDKYQKIINAELKRAEEDKK